MTDDPRADDDRVRHPFRLGLIVSSTVLAAYGVAATIRLLRYGEILADADWRLLIAIPACLVAAGFGYAYLGAAIGARRAHALLVWVFGLLLVVGVYAMVRYLENRRS